MRKYHRSISLVVALFLILIATTGILLEYKRLFPRGLGLISASVASEAENQSSLNNNLYSPEVAASLQGLKNHIKDPRISSLKLELLAKNPTVTFYSVDPEISKIVVDANSGEIKKVIKKSTKKKPWIIRLHTGSIFGKVGRAFGIIWGLALIFLSISGLYLYWQMYSARAKKYGWRGIFW